MFFGLHSKKLTDPFLKGHQRLKLALARQSDAPASVSW